MVVNYWMHNSLTIRKLLQDMPNYAEEDLPPEPLTVEGRVWTREQFDEDGYQWIREMDDTEYDWDPEGDEVSLVGIDVPIRAVSLQFYDGTWHVEGVETAGPSYHRPGFTESIGPEYSTTYPAGAEEEAFKEVRKLAQRLS